MSATHKRILLATWIVGGLTMGTIEAALTVTNLDDSGPGSLRQTIADAAPGDTIVFDASLNGGVITLTSGQLDLDKPLVILGPGPDQLAINGNAASRIFNMDQSFYPSSGTYSYWISGLTISNGLASVDDGGGIRSSLDAHQWTFRLTISNCVIRANQVTASNARGGGIHASRYTILTLVDSEISGNLATGNGGGLWTGFTALVERCLFADNTTGGSGGGLFINQHDKAVVRNCTVTGNRSTYTDWNTALVGGGGIFCNKPTVDILNTTITGNFARRGGGLRVNDSESVVFLHSTLVSGNSDNDGFPDVVGTFLGLTNCLVSVTNAVSLPGANNIFGQDARLDVLADNGGLTRTHALLKNSPAIDAGYNPLALATDQRGPGFPRLLGLAVDIGAYEFLPPPPATLICIR